MSLQPRKPLRDLLSISFNQDAGCFSVGLVNGFKVLTTEPYSEPYRRDFESGGVAVAEMLFRSNILALVGGGPIPKFPPNKVMIWDDHQGRAVGELLFKTPVKSVCLKKDRIAIALEHKVYLYDIEDLKQLQNVETAPNPDGLLALSPCEGATVLACPGLHAGQVRIDLLDTRRIKIIDAHNSQLAALALSHNGKYVATASEKGTLIRIFSTADGAKIHEVRRGSDPAKIYSLAFSRSENSTPEWLAATSDKGTAHIFNLTARTSAKGSSSSGGGGGGAHEDEDAAVEMSGSPATYRSSSGRMVLKSLSSLTKFVPSKVGGAYLASEWSWAQYRLPDGHKCIVALGKEPGTVLLASVTGAFHQVAFDPDRKGPCQQISYTLFMEDEDSKEA